MKVSEAKPGDHIQVATLGKFPPPFEGVYRVTQYQDIPSKVRAMDWTGKYVYLCPTNQCRFAKE